jgi:hypothetical protein
MKTSQTLRAALNLLKTKGWTQGALARDANGSEVPYSRQDATCFCALGAVAHAARGDSAVEGLAWDALDNTAKTRGFQDVVQYNDFKDTEFKHVRALFGKAILECEKEGD